MKQFSFIYISLLLSINSFSQNKQIPVYTEIAGVLLNVENQEPLPYVNIINLKNGKGTISNENGNFSVNTSNLKNNDTIRFQCIGFKTKNIAIADLRNNTTIALHENIYNLNEILILGSTPSAEFIVKNILIHKDQNYKTPTHKKQAFIRYKDNTDIITFKLDPKKNTIKEVTPEILKIIENKIPKHSISHRDFLVDIYTKKNKEGSVEIKIDPKKTVELTSKDITELGAVEDIFDSLFNNTNDDEYWKIKTGVFKVKLDISNKEKTSINDSIKEEEKTTSFSLKEDTLKEDKDTREIKILHSSTKSNLYYATLKSEKIWEFLHKTERYRYTIKGATSINGESAYIIDFTPRYRGTYKGRLYVSINTSALIRADYEFAEGKKGKGFYLFGIGYTHSAFKGSIHFDKIDDNYQLKYSSYQSTYTINVDRKIALQKKKRRFLFDKKLKEVKVDMDFTAAFKESIEVLVIDNEKLPDIEYHNFKERERAKITYVNQFDENLWKDYSIIEPTKQMKEFKKIK